MEAPVASHIIGSERPGFSAFLIDERAVQGGSASSVTDQLEAAGFEQLLTVVLEEQQRIALRESMTFTSGVGDGIDRAAMAVFAVDLLPQEPEAKDRTKYPHRDNARISLAQRLVRHAVNADRARPQQFEPLLPCETEDLAWLALRQLAPHREPRLRNEIEERAAEFKTEGAVSRLPSGGDRAKVELVWHEGRIAVRKTFRRSAIRFLDREIQVMSKLGGVFPEIPLLLAHGANFLVMEQAKGIPIRKLRSDPPQPLPLRDVRRLACFLRRCLAAGYDPVDLKPSRNVFFGEPGIQVIDFEFWVPARPSWPEESLCLKGLPKGFSDALFRPFPAVFDAVFDPYPRYWLPYVCLSMHSFLNDPPWLQRVKRPAYVLLAYGRWLVAVGAKLTVRLIGRPGLITGRS